MKNDFKEDFEYRKPQSKAKKKNSHKDLLIGILIIIVAILTAYVINSEKLSIVSDDSSSEYSTTILSDDESKYNDLQDDTEITSRSSQAETQTEQAEQTERTDSDYIEYHFRYTDRLDEHYIKHGIEMGFTSAEEYEKRASDIINSPDALTKNEKEDNDFCYFIESTGEFVVLSTDGYIRTYYITDKSYFDRQ